MASLDSGGVERTRFTAHQYTAGETEFGQREQAAGSKRAGTIGDTLAAFEGGANGRMGFVALKFFVGRQPWIGVIKANDQPYYDHIVVEVIQEGAPIGIGIKRPSRRVNNQPRLRLRGVDLPHFLDANGIALRIFALVKLEALD